MKKAATACRRPSRVFGIARCCLEATRRAPPDLVCGSTPPPLVRMAQVPRLPGLLVGSCSLAQLGTASSATTSQQPTQERQRIGFWRAPTPQAGGPVVGNRIGVLADMTKTITQTKDTDMSNKRIQPKLLKPSGVDLNAVTTEIPQRELPAKKKTGGSYECPDCGRKIHFRIG